MLSSRNPGFKIQSWSFNVIRKETILQFFDQMRSLTDSDAAIYSASVDDSAVHRCVREPLEIGELPKRNLKPLMERLVLPSHAQSESL